MTEAERIARAQRATNALEEFVAPILAEVRDEYLKRMASEATTELHRERRADKVTALAQALRILDNLESGLSEVIRDGEMAARDKLRDDRILDMTDAQQRMLKIAPR